MLTKDPVMIKEMGEKESSEVAKKCNITPRAMAKTLVSLNKMGRKPVVNPSAGKSG